MKKNIYTLTIILLAFTPLYVSAQENNTLRTPAAYENYKLRNLWQQTNNAAGSLISYPMQISELKTGYGMEKGDYKRPQQGKEANNIYIDTEGALILNKSYVWGSFSYSRDKMTDVTYNASIIDPYRGMPYYAADTLPSNWNNQYYDLKFRAATPKLSKIISLGIEGSYKAYMGAKQRDPRTENNYYEIDFKPGMVVSFTDKHNVGLNLNYKNYKEESLMSKININVDPVYYELYGLGTAVKRIGSGRTTNYEGNQLGVGLQYNYKAFVDLLLSANYSAKVEDVKISYSYPRDEATTKEQLFNLNLTVYKEFEDFAHYLNLGFINRDIDGIQYVTQYDNTVGNEGWKSLFKSIRSNYTTNNASAKYIFLINRGAEYDWKFDLGINYNKQKDEYILPYSFKNYENMIIDFGVKKNFVVSRDLCRRLLTGINYSYKNNMSGVYSYNGQHPEYSIVTDFEENDFSYLTSNNNLINGAIIYSQQFKENSKIHLLAKINVTWIGRNNPILNDRIRNEFSIGMNF